MIALSQLCVARWNSRSKEVEYVPTTGLIRSVLQLLPKNGDYDSVIEFFREQRVLEQARDSGGLVEATINIPVSRSGPMLIIAVWQTSADYDRWLSNPGRAAFTPRLAALVEAEPGTGATYEIKVHLGESEPA